MKIYGLRVNRQLRRTGGKRLPYFIMIERPGTRFPRDPPVASLLPVQSKKKVKGTTLIHWRKPDLWVSRPVAGDRSAERRLKCQRTGLN